MDHRKGHRLAPGAGRARTGQSAEGLSVISGDSERKSAISQFGQYFRRLRFSDPNPIAGHMNWPPQLQIAWFLFAGVVGMTLGVFGEVNRRENPNNVWGGILSMLFGLVGFGLAVRAYLRGRRSRSSRRINSAP